MGKGTRKPRKQEAKAGTLGTFAGVFTPSILTILGIILFLRLGFVVGNAGLGITLIILILANGISVLTSFSLSAIATNLKVKGGGDYYLISRTLGLEFGGAIGIVLFLAQSVSIAFYCIGFGEVLAGILSIKIQILPQLIAAIAVAFLFIFAWLGADWATRFQYLVMSILSAALLSFFIGGAIKWDANLFIQNWGSTPSGLKFWAIFAIFFPAVTGFTQGVSMSGDLKDAGKSLPLGTFLAVGISVVIYFLAAMVLSASLSREILINDYVSMGKVALFDFLIVAGVIAATLSSAMASFLGAPRILQSLAGDRIFPFLLPFAKGDGPNQNPRRGVLLSAAIAFATIGLGRLNIIAPVVSMFFLISYGLLNYATYYEARTGSPSFRPRFRWYDARLSLVGSLVCLGTMLAIDVYSGVIALAILLAIHQYLKRTSARARWADSRRSYHLQRIREHLLAAAKEPEHPRDWRPQLLVFSNDSHRRIELLQFASWFEGETGFATAVKIIEGQGPKMLKIKAEVEEELLRDIIDNNFEAFPLVLVVPDQTLGIHTLVQSYGIGPLHANTVLFNWFENLPQNSRPFHEFMYGRRLKTAFRLGCNLIVLNAEQDKWTALGEIPSHERRIDVWWWGDTSSQLMLLLAYLMTRSAAWEDARIRVMAAGFSQETDPTIEGLRQRLEEIRIDAEPEKIEASNGAAIASHSSDATLVFLPFRLRGNQPLDPFGEPIHPLLSRLPITAMVMAAEDIDLDAEPEEGKAGEITEALDAIEDAESRARNAEKDADKAASAAEAAQEKLQQLEKRARTDEVDEAEVEALKAAADQAEEVAMQAKRRFAKAEAKAKSAAQEAEALGVKLTKTDEEVPEASDPDKEP